MAPVLSAVVCFIKESWHEDAPTKTQAVSRKRFSVAPELIVPISSASWAFHSPHEKGFGP